LIAIDVESLVAPISADAPSGQNLEYDPEFAEMERAAQGTPEQQYGSTIIEGKEPEWVEVAKSANGLLKRTHDLRVAMYLARSSLKSSGWQAYRDSLKVLRSYVVDFWESVHPQLDPDDDLDPTTRVNTIATLCDNVAMLNLLRTVPIVSSRTAGQFSHRDIGYATGEIPYVGPADAKPKPALIDAAFTDCDLEQLKKNTQALTDAVDYVKEIEKSLTKQVGAGNARSLDPAVKELDAIRKILLERLSRRGGSLNSDAPAAAAGDNDADVDVDIDVDSDDEPSSGRGGRSVAVRRDWNEDIDSRDDAIKVLEKVIRYFEIYEPSSPLPLLLRRAMRLSTKSFLEILRDISPDGLSQAETLGGMSSEEYTQMAAASAAARPVAQARPAAAAPPPPPPPPPPSSSSMDY
jgi:type VI secretion system protein ImpA